MSKLLDVHQRLVRSRLNRKGLKSCYHGPAGNRIHAYTYRGQNEGIPFVLIHGLGTHASAYAPLLERLCPHAKSIMAPELPGHGFSDLPRPIPSPKESFIRLAGLLDSLIEEPTVVIGTSLGGAIALKYALHSPDKIKRLFLVSPAGAPMSAEGMAHVRGLFHQTCAADGRKFLKQLFHRPPWYVPLIGASVQRLLSRPIVRTFLESDHQQEALTVEDAARLRPETMLIWGTSERILPSECLDWYRTHMPKNVTIERPRDYGHSPHLEVPDSLTDRILKFARAGGSP
jgi:pimeloyl-ACP methyl ester carboxylesterase